MKRFFLFFALSAFLMISACVTFTFQLPIATPSLRPTLTPTRSSTPTRIKTPTPLLFRRLENGAYIKGENGKCTGSCNTLTVVNGSQDTAVLLQVSMQPRMDSTKNPLPTQTDPGVATIVAVLSVPMEKLPVSDAVYLQAGKRFTFRAMWGTYRICFTQGEDWDSQMNRFTRHASYSCLKDDIYFAMTPPRFKIMTITLDPVKAGNLALIPQTQASFPHINK